MVLSVVIVDQLSWRVRAWCTVATSRDSGRLPSDMSRVLIDR